ncbi:MAG: nuclear transport factor 2 family protein [Vicinamibacterales bacterium]
MADANVRLVESMYEAFGRGDAATVLSALDPGIVWHEAENIAYADRNPYVGPQQVAEGVFGRIMTEWDGFTVTPEQYIAAGEHVVATGRYRGTYKATGVPLDAQFVHVWTLRGGRAVAFQQYADTLQFARAVHGSAAGG